MESASELDRIFTPAGSSALDLAAGAWDTFYPTFARAVRGLGPAPVAASDAVATAEVLDAARRSADSGQVVRLTTVTDGPG